MNTVPEDKTIEQLGDPQLAEESVEEYVVEKYRSLNPLAVLSGVFGLLSILTVFTWFFGVIPVTGIVLGFLALRQIDRAPEETAGRAMARAGMGLCVVLWALGGYLYKAWQSEVPPGYKRVTFAMLQPDETVAGQKLPKNAIDLDGERVFIKGFMYPGRQTIAIKEFLLVPTRTHCKFCSSNIPSTEMIQVEMMGDLTVNFTTDMAGVGGQLMVNPAAGSGGLPYRLEADHFR
jgi:hypothetical protein